jgi:hypothetical protein
VKTVEIPAPPSGVDIEGKQTLIGERLQKLDREEWVACGPLLHQIRCQNPCDRSALNPTLSWILGRMKRGPAQTRPPKIRAKPRSDIYRDIAGQRACYRGVCLVTVGNKPTISDDCGSPERDRKLLARCAGVVASPSWSAANHVLSKSNQFHVSELDHVPQRRHASRPAATVFPPRG